MLVTTVISGTRLLTSHGHVTSLLQFIMVLANDTEIASYFCQHQKQCVIIKNNLQFTKQILKIYYKK